VERSNGRRGSTSTTGVSATDVGRGR
jgi:hypothetical protein